MCARDDLMVSVLSVSLLMVLGMADLAIELTTCLMVNGYGVQSHGLSHSWAAWERGCARVWPLFQVCGSCDLEKNEGLDIPHGVAVLSESSLLETRCVCFLGPQGCGCGCGVAIHVPPSYLLPRLEGSFLSSTLSV